MTEHKHAAILRAIANGKTEFQRFYEGEEDWEDCKVEDILYYILHEMENPKLRIKPETKTGWLIVRKDGYCYLYKDKQTPLLDRDFGGIAEAQIQITYTPGEGL